MVGSAAFAGRQGEVSRLLRALDGGGRLVLVVGDAGVGKTRLVAEVMGRARSGRVVLRGECLPLTGVLPMLPIVSALGQLAALGGGGVMAAALEEAPTFVRGEVGRL